MLAVVAAFNWYVDPFASFGNNRFGAYFSSERQFKLSMAPRYAHDALILGSSRFALIDPAAIEGRRFFNAAFSAALPEEILRYVREPLNGVKLVVVGLDEYMFDEARHPLQPDPLQAELAVWSKVKSLLSVDLLFKSIMAIRSWALGAESYIGRDGHTITSKFDQRDRSMSSPSYDPEILEQTRILMKNFRYSPRRIEVLAALRQELDRRGIEYVVIVNPTNPAMFDNDGVLRSALERLIADLRGVFPSLVSYAGTRYADAEHYYRFDPAHYRPEVGARMINEALSQARTRLE